MGEVREKAKRVELDRWGRRLQWSEVSEVNEEWAGKTLHQAKS